MPVGLAAERADDAFGDGVIEALRRADAEDCLAEADVVFCRKRNEGKILLVDFDDGEIGIAIGADERGVLDAHFAR